MSIMDRQTIDQPLTPHARGHMLKAREVTK